MLGGANILSLSSSVDLSLCFKRLAVSVTAASGGASRLKKRHLVKALV